MCGVLGVCGVPGLGDAIELVPVVLCNAAGWELWILSVTKCVTSFTRKNSMDCEKRYDKIKWTVRLRPCGKIVKYTYATKFNDFSIDSTG